MKLKNILINLFPILLLVQVIIDFFKYLDKKTTTRLYHPDSLERLHEADLYIRNRKNYGYGI